MTPFIGMPLLALLAIATSTLIGLGPAVRLAREPLLAPVLGLGLAAAVLVTVGYLVPLGVAGPILLVLGGVASAVWARPALRRARSRQTMWAGVGLLVLGTALALLPALMHGSYGPVDLHFNDSWFYASLDWYLQHHTAGAPVGDVSSAPALGLVAFPQASHARLGIDAWQASLGSLAGTDAALTQQAFQAAEVGIIAITAFALAVRFTAMPVGWAAVLGLLSLSPQTVQLFADPRPANLAAIALAPVGLAFGARAMTRSGERRDIIVAAIAAAGLTVTYIEHGPTVVGAAGLALIVTLVLGRHRTERLRRLAVVVGLVLLGAFVLSPAGVVRAVHYLGALGDTARAGSPAQAGVELHTLPLLLTGAMHLYELDELAGATTIVKVAAYGFAVLVLALGAVGVIGVWWRRKDAPLILPAAGVLVIGALLATRFQLAGPDCGDCVYKSLTLAPVCLAVCVVAGGCTLLRTRFPYRRLVVGLAMLIVGAGMARGDVRLLQGTERVQSQLSPDTVSLVGDVKRLPPSAPVLLEGTGSGGGTAGFFDFPALLYLLGRSPAHPLRWEGALNGLASAYGLPAEPYAPDYRYVVSRFPGVQSGRRMIASRGQYALQTRAPVDLHIIDGDGIRDPRDAGADAIPWLRGPLALNVVGASRGAAVTLDFRGTATADLAPSATGAELMYQPGTAGRGRACLDIPAGAETQAVTFVPGFTVPPGPVDEVEALPRAPRLLGLSGWAVRVGGRCRRR